MKAIPALLIPALLLAPALASAAGVTITLDNPNQSGMAGDVLSFTGVVTNDDPDNAVYLNNVTWTLASDDLTFDGFDDLFNNLYAPIDPGGSTPDVELFTVTIGDPLVDPANTYNGNYVLLGGADVDAQESLGNVDFSVTTLTPEPGSLMMLASGCLVLGSLRRLRLTSRAKRQSQRCA